MFEGLPEPELERLRDLLVQMQANLKHFRP
jgi:hypothetical protein